MSNKNQVITYVPQSEGDEPGDDMRGLRRVAWHYTNRWGLNFFLALCLALAFQLFVAVFLAFYAVIKLPILANIPQDNPAGQVLRILGALAIAFVIQAALVAETAQVVWLRKPDWLKIRLMKDSVWWWIMLIGLILTLVIDYLLFLLAITGARTLGDAIAVYKTDSILFLTTIALSLLNFLSLLRAASVMKTSTSKEIKFEVEERLKAIAEEILIDAGDNARKKATRVWKELSVNPQRLIPLQNSVLDLISKQHPELVPPDMGGSTWAYDFGGNKFAALPPDVHQALLQTRYRAAGRGLADPEQSHLWGMPSQDLAQAITFNLEEYGAPAFVDATQPEQPKFITRPIRYEALAGTESEKGEKEQPARDAATVLVDAATSFVAGLPKGERLGYGAYLAATVFPQLRGYPYIPMPDSSIFDAFDVVELQWYYRQWKQNQAFVVPGKGI